MRDVRGDAAASVDLPEVRADGERGVVTVVVLRGDARRLPLPDGCVDLVVTSPPYFGLRSYTDAACTTAARSGSEATPQEWVAALVACTGEWVRVLKPSGYVRQPRRQVRAARGRRTVIIEGCRARRSQVRGGKSRRPLDRSAAVSRLAPPKSLLGLPWRYALACTDQLGLILRRDIMGKGETRSRNL